MGDALSRVCACPCKRPLVDRRESARYVDARHRQRAYEERRAVELRSAGFPSRLSKKLAEATNGTQNCQSDGYRPVSARRSGLQLTRDKAIAAAKRTVFLFVGEVDPDLVQQCAEREINRELSDRQRAELHAREQRRARREQMEAEQAPGETGA